MVRKLEIQGGGNYAKTFCPSARAQGQQALNVPSPFSTRAEAATLGI